MRCRRTVWLAFCLAVVALSATAASAATINLTGITNNSTCVTGNADDSNSLEQIYTPANNACSEPTGGSDSNFMRLSNTGTTSSSAGPGGSTSIGFNIDAGVAADSAVDGQDEYELGKIRYTLNFSVTATAVEDWSINLSQNVLGLFGLAGDGSATAVGSQVNGNGGISPLTVVANSNNVSFSAAPAAFAGNPANNDESSVPFSGSRNDSGIASGTGNGAFSVTISFDIDAFSNAGCTGFICSSASGGEDAAVLLGYNDVDDCCGGTAEGIRADNYSEWGRSVGPDGYNSTWTLNVSTDCGDGNLDAGEACDEGPATGTNGSCCTSLCQFRPAQDICRPAAGFCDLFETCSGASGTCPADAFEPPSTVCRNTSVGDVCDAVEFCTGGTANCPADGVDPAGTPCRTAASLCDAAENCDGVAKTCPADLPLANGTLCRAAVGNCDIAEFCNGVSFACPANALVGPGTECRSSAGICDLAEVCTGFSGTCPANSFLSGSMCRASAGVCDVAETCTGGGPSCPADAFASGNPCRASAGVCDIAETCNGGGPNCPADAFASGNPCRASAGVCDVAETCTGGGPSCPADAFASGNECRADAGQCDVAESCNGSGASCPANVFEPDGTTCDDSMMSTEDDQCLAGLCAGTEPPGLDPFKCYKAKDLRNPKFVKTNIASLVDQFGSETNAYLTRPYMHCNPADVDGGGINNATDHLVCYKVKPQNLSPRPRFEVTNSLGTLQLEAKKSFVICLPSSKTLLP